jgi:hypothetical protein
MTDWAMIGAPTSAGAHHASQERAPDALRHAGLADRLTAAGEAVRDLGNLPAAPFAVDHDHPQVFSPGRACTSRKPRRSPPTRPARPRGPWRRSRRPAGRSWSTSTVNPTHDTDGSLLRRYVDGVVRALAARS